MEDVLNVSVSERQRGQQVFKEGEDEYSVHLERRPLAFLNTFSLQKVLYSEL